MSGSVELDTEDLAACLEAGADVVAESGRINIPIVMRQAAARLRSMKEALKRIASGEYEEYDEELRCPVLVPMDGELASDIACAALRGDGQ